MPSLGELVEQAKGLLEQYTVNRPATATFADWQRDGSNNIVGVKLVNVGAGDRLLNTIAELETGELVHIGSYDVNNNTCICPPWFRGQQGTPKTDTVTPNSKVVLEPLWPSWQITTKVCEGIQALYPDLFAVKDAELSSSSVNGNYLLPDDVEGILHLTVENVGPGMEQLKLWVWSLDVSNLDGKRYLRTRTTALAGRPIHVTYRAKPLVPSRLDLTVDWTTTGLPDSAADLPVLYAVYTMLPAVEAAKTQMHSVEQSDRNKYVQGGAGNAASRRFQEMYERRLFDERRKLLDQHPPRTHKQWNG